MTFVPDDEPSPVRYAEPDVPFAQVPRWLVDLDPPLSSRAMHLYVILARHAIGEKRAIPGRRRLAGMLGVDSPNTVRVAIGELEKRGAVRSAPRYRPDGSQTSNEYVLAYAAPLGEPLPPTSTSRGGPARKSRGGRSISEGGPARSPSLLGEEGVGEEGVGEETPAASPTDGVVDAIKRVWDAKTPRPSTPFVAAVQIARRLIGSGWNLSDVETAMIEAPTLTTSAIEVALRRARPTRATAPRQQHVERTNAPTTRRLEL